MEMLELIEAAGILFTILLGSVIAFWVWVIVAIVKSIIRISVAAQEKAEAYTRRARAYERFVDLQCIKYEESKGVDYEYDRDNDSY